MYINGLRSSPKTVTRNEQTMSRGARVSNQLASQKGDWKTNPDRAATGADQSGFISIVAESVWWRIVFLLAGPIRRGLADEPLQVQCQRFALSLTQGERW